MNDPVALPPVPTSLLAPLLQCAGEMLHDLEGEEVPPVVRPLLGFDRRGFGSTAARSQLQAALAGDETFRQVVFDAFRERPEVQALLDDWDPREVMAIVVAAAERDDLAVLASALVAVQPESWELALGVVLALHEQGLAQREGEDDRRAFETRIDKVEEARRRAEAEVEQLRRTVGELEGELADERSSRRDREDAVREEVRELEARIGELEAEIERLRGELEQAEVQASREAARVAKAETALGEARAEAARERSRADAAERERKEVEREARAARDALAAAADARRVESPSPVGDDGSGGDRARPTRRVRPPVPPGMIGASPEGLEATLRTGGGAALVVDGYNVSMLAWPDEPIDTQRQRLCASLERFHLRIKAPITVVFDGADVEGVRPPRRPGVRVLFSEPGEEADDVVIREVRATPLEQPVVVVSSDRAVQDEAERDGALAVPSPVLLEVLRR